MSNPALNGSGKRACESWIDAFVSHTDNLESAPLFRKWAAITTISATLEQKVWVTTGSPLYPNLYVFLVGPAGIGKSRVISASTGFISELPELHLGPTSPTMASLVDHLVEAKRTIINLPDPAYEYNSMYLVADELSAFMHEFDPGLVGGLTTFFDVVPYSQSRRTKDVRIKMQRPQLNILSGATPSNLMKLIPDYAWEQGFTSRFIMVYADEKPTIDVFNTPNKPKPEEMIHDLKLISTLQGQMGWTDDFAKAMHQWKLLGFIPSPQHPKLQSYCARRFSHLIKLSMVACVDRGNELVLRVEDFNRAMGWLLEAEATMPEIFRVGLTSSDAKVMEEIAHFVRRRGETSEHLIVGFARERVPAYAVKSVIDVMVNSGMIVSIGQDLKTGLRIFTAS